MKRDLEPITPSSRMIEAVSVGDRYSLAGSHGQAAAYPKHVHARACVTPRWRVRSNNARRNTRLYDNEAASPKLMPVYYEARRSKSIETRSTGCLPARIRYDFRDPPNENSNPRGGWWLRTRVSITTLIAALANFPRSLITLRTLGIWVKFDRPLRCPVSAIRWFIAIEHDRAKQESWRAVAVSLVYRYLLSVFVLTFFFFLPHFSFFSF